MIQFDKKNHSDVLQPNDLTVIKNFRIFSFFDSDFESMTELISSDTAKNVIHFKSLLILININNSDNIEIMNSDIKIECYKNLFSSICSHNEVSSFNGLYEKKTKEFGFEEIDNTIAILTTTRTVG